MADPRLAQSWWRGGGGGVFLATGQLTGYSIGDDGDFQKGTAKAYTVLNAGAYAGSTNIDVPTYAAADIGFTNSGSALLPDTLTFVVDASSKFVNVQDALNATFVNGGAGKDTITRAAGSWLTNFTAGQIIYTTGAVNAPNNTLRTVDSVAALTLTLTSIGQLVNEGPVAVVISRETDQIVVLGAANAGNNAVRKVVRNVANTLSLTQGNVQTVEAAGAYVTICKRAAISNQCAEDNNVVVAGVKCMWMSYTSSGLKIGALSTGLLVWYDVAQAYILHPAAADLQAVAPNIIRIVGGAGEFSRYNVGHCIVMAGWANAVNNLPGYPILLVAVNGADLDITVKNNSVRSTLISEAAAGARSIQVVCNSIFAYAAACNAALVSGKADWRVPNVEILYTLLGKTTGQPDSIAFPSGFGGYKSIWPSTTRPDSTTYANAPQSTAAYIGVVDIKTGAYQVILMRGP